ncbi:Uncharacterized protein Fot_19261 [Forsythia ovata]|uniref:Uncharacterized protein n=1 Tax=Forsythia ovata TaxID=205694 RepID=A0ABD1VKI2_9LAMI
MILESIHAQNTVVLLATPTSIHHFTSLAPTSVPQFTIPGVIPEVARSSPMPREPNTGAIHQAAPAVLFSSIATNKGRPTVDLRPLPEHILHEHGLNELILRRANLNWCLAVHLG